MEDKLVILRGILKYRPESTSAVKKRRREYGCEGRSESEQKRLKLQVPKSNVDRFATARLQIGILRHGVRDRKIVHSRIRSLIHRANQIETEKETSHPLNQVNENDDVSKQNLSSPFMKTLDEKSANFAVPSHLIVKAANTAAQWLKFFHEDLNRRLAVLQRNAARVRAAPKEIHLIIYKQFSNPSKFFSAINEKKKNVHLAKWNGIFSQMGWLLYNEERNMKNLLKQVEEMQLLCGSGGEKGLVVRATADSFYSTCNKMVYSMLLNGSITST